MADATQLMPTRDVVSGQSKYDFNQRVFPSDLGTGSSYNNHYMVININVQNDSLMSRVNGNDIFTRSGEFSTRDRLRYDIDPTYTLSRFNAGNGTYTDAKYSQPIVDKIRQKFTRRIQESIALYMPSTEVTYSDNHDYTNISLTKFATTFLEAGANLVGAGIGAFTRGPGSVTETGGGLGGIIDPIKGYIGPVAGVALNRPINPRVELLYSNTNQREFTFDFLFAPSDEKESQALEQIIKTLRFHAAPEARGGGSFDYQATGGGILNDIGSGILTTVSGIAGEVDSFFWVPPSEFDITFYHNGVENTKIPRINTCVLKGVDVSYSPNGTYSTFSNGYPVHTRVVLRFSEVEVINKLRVLQGF